MEKGKYTVSPGTEYTKSAQSDELKTTWKQVTDCIKNQSWKAIYAKTDAEFNKAVAKMRKDTKGYGYDECLKWSQNEAATRKSLEDQLTQ
jgi:multiple sugar transport system substrate-binding protein/putative aldouronate transport system substrate-binding protein